MSKECMNDDCISFAHWRSEDGYPFCNDHGYEIYTAECEFDDVEPLPLAAWIADGRPHGPITYC